MKITIVLGSIADKLIAFGDVVLTIFVLEVPFDFSHHHFKEQTGGLRLCTCVELNLI